MNESDRAEHPRSMYRKVLEALDEAQPCLERMPADGADEQNTVRSGAFRLGMAGGIAFRGRLPGVESDALFDDISDAAEARDPGRADRIRQGILARLEPGQSLGESPSDEGGLDLEAGFLQKLAALNEARRAWRENDRFRHSLMLGFLTGLLNSARPWRYGSHLADAVIAVHSRNPRKARRWLEAESIEAEEWRGESTETDERALLLRWVADRLAAGHRFSEPLWSHSVDETDAERRKREAWERAYFERQEASIQRAQNFGKRMAAADGEGIWIPTSYAVNRALVLGSQEEE